MVTASARGCCCNHCHRLGSPFNRGSFTGGGITAGQRYPVWERCIWSAGLLHCGVALGGRRGVVWELRQRPPTPPNKDGPRERPPLLDMDHYDNCAVSDSWILASVGEFLGLFRYAFVQFDYLDNYFIYVVYK